MNSSNLQNDAYHTDTDTLGAVALSGKFGSLLFRVKFANDASSYPQLRLEWIERVMRHANRKHWPTRLKIGTLATEVLDFWVHDVCSDCNGLGLERHASAPMLTTTLCTTCNGTGTAPFKSQTCREHNKYAPELLDILQTMAIDAGSQAIKKLGDAINF